MTEPKHVSEIIPQAMAGLRANVPPLPTVVVDTREQNPLELGEDALEKNHIKLDLDCEKWQLFGRHESIIYCKTYPTGRDHHCWRCD